MTSILANVFDHVVSIKRKAELNRAESKSYGR